MSLRRLPVSTNDGSQIMDGIESSCVAPPVASGGLALSQDIDAVLAGFEALSIPLLICDRAGQVIARSSEAARLLREGVLIQLNGFVLRAACRACDADLADALRKAANLAPPALSTILLRTRDWSEVARAEIAALPTSGSSLGHGLIGVAIIRRTRTDARHILMRLGLTAAEVEVCACLVGSAAYPAIAKAHATWAPKPPLPRPSRSTRNSACGGRVSWPRGLWACCRRVERGQWAFERVCVLVPISPVVSDSRSAPGGWTVKYGDLP